MLSRLRLAMLVKGQTQRELSASAGIAETRYSKIIRGVSPATVGERDSISRALGLPPTKTARLFTNESLPSPDDGHAVAKAAAEIAVEDFESVATVFATVGADATELERRYLTNVLAAAQRRLLNTGRAIERATGTRQDAGAVQKLGGSVVPTDSARVTEVAGLLTQLDTERDEMKRAIAVARLAALILPYRPVPGPTLTSTPLVGQGR